MAVPGFEKGRYGPGLERRLYPIATFNSLCARPLSWLLALLGFTPNLVSLLSLAVSGLALWRIADGAWSPLVQGALLLHLGLLLDHADGQVARRRSMGTNGGMYLDMVIDRVVEAGLLVA
ncbi:MAG TPA: CDP-alcohol phosphatidyltransferase family protein, partial [Candidatus Thermoplasmatota archaeon]|nr:CDP-alcohol phosphatidyltransferase family protein [Candidatus Thermoplasmatota archaeon]